MNATSLVLSLLVYGLVVLLTVGIHFGARCSGVWSDRRRRGTCGLLLIGGALFSGFVYATDSQLRATTLHERVFQPQGTHTYETAFDVESPGVQHTLLLAPLADAWSPANSPLRVRIELISADGQVLIDEDHTFPLRTEYVRGSRPQRRFEVWDSTSIAFSPPLAEPHRLAITARQDILPELHVRVDDPTKTDGRRAAGY